MNNIDVANGIIFQKMEISKETFEDRLISQKKIYLLQALGTDLGYSYNWYVRGPYSPSLTNYIYNNLDILSANDFSQCSLSEEASRNVQRVNSLADAKRQDMSVASWYELLASLLYISNNKESWQISDENEKLFQILVQNKPQYNVEQCRYAYKILCSQGFVKVGA